MAIKDLPAVWRQVCPDKLISFALFVTPCSVSVYWLWLLNVLLAGLLCLLL